MCKGEEEMKEKDNNVIPVQEGSEIDIEILNIGEKGDGFGKIAGYVVFVPNAMPGKRYRIKINRCLNKYGFGDIVEVLD